VQWAWLASWAEWVRLPLLPACRVRFLHAMRLTSRAGTEGLSVSCYKCERPSHPDWGRLGVVRAAGIDNRWQEGGTLAPCQRNQPAKLGSINVQYKPQC